MSSFSPLPRISIGEAQGFATSLREAVALRTPIGIDGAAFEKVDLTGIQLLISAHRSALAQGTGFTVSVPSASPLHAALLAHGLLDAAGTYAPGAHPFGPVATVSA